MKPSFYLLILGILFGSQPGCMIDNSIKGGLDLRTEADPIPPALPPPDPPALATDFTDISNAVLGSLLTSNTVHFGSMGSNLPVSISASGGAEAWDISQIRDFSEGQFVSFTAQDTSPRGFSFSANGKRLYVTGTNTGFVYQYSLVVAYDLATLANDNIALDVNPQDPLPISVEFNTDGTKMFLCGYTNKSIYQYRLTVGFDLSTAVYDSVVFPLNSEDGSPENIRFNPTGDLLYMVGDTNTTLYQYQLTIPFDLSTIAYDNTNLPVGSEDTDPRSITFSQDGTKMYLLGFQNLSIYRYSLSTGFDLDTAIYDSVSTTTSYFETLPSTLEMGPKNLHLYVLGQAKNRINKIKLVSANSLSGLSFDTQTALTLTEGASGFSISFNSDGSKMFTLMDGGNEIFQYSLGVNYDTTTLTYDGISEPVVSEDSQPRSILFNNDGSKLYMLGTNGNQVHQYSLSPNYAISGMSSDSKTLDVSPENANPLAIAFNATGTKLYMSGDDPGTAGLYQYTLTIAFDMSTASYDGVSFSLTGQMSRPTSIEFSQDGSQLFVLDYATKYIYKYVLAINYDLSTIAYDFKKSYVGIDTESPRSISFQPGGNKLFVYGSVEQSVFQYDLPTSYEPIYDSRPVENSFPVAALDTGPRDIWFNPDGSIMYILGAVSTTIYQFSLSRNFEVTSAVYEGLNLNLGGLDSSPRSINFNPDGSKFYFSGVDTNSIYQYTVAIPYNISTATYDTLSLGTALQDGVPHSFVFNGDGSKLILLGDATDTLYQFNLPSNYSLIGASYDGVSFPIGTEETGSRTLSFNNDGSRLFILGPDTGAIHQYTLSINFDIGTMNYDMIVSDKTSPFKKLFR